MDELRNRNRSCCVILGSLGSHCAQSPGLFAQLGELAPLLEEFTIEEERQMKRMLQRMDVLAKVILHTFKRLITYTHLEGNT